MESSLTYKIVAIRKQINHIIYGVMAKIRKKTDVPNERDKT